MKHYGALRDVMGALQNVTELLRNFTEPLRKISMIGLCQSLIEF